MLGHQYWLITKFFILLEISIQGTNNVKGNEIIVEQHRTFWYHFCFLCFWKPKQWKVWKHPLFSFLVWKQFLRIQKQLLGFPTTGLVSNSSPNKFYLFYVKWKQKQKMKMIPNKPLIIVYWVSFMLLYVGGSRTSFWATSVYEITLLYIRSIYSLNGERVRELQFNSFC